MNNDSAPTVLELPTAEQIADWAQSLRARLQNGWISYAYAGELPDELSIPSYFADKLAGLTRKAQGCAAGERLRALGVDLDILALAELLQVELAGVGPPEGILRSQPKSAMHCVAFRALCDHLESTTSLAKRALWQRAVDARGSRVSLVSAPLRRRFDRLYQFLYRDEAARDNILVRAAAAHDQNDGRFFTAQPILVEEVLGWGIDMRVDPTMDGAWMVDAQVRWLEPDQAPTELQAITLTLQMGLPPVIRQIEKQIGPTKRHIAWYENQSLGSAPKARARRTQAPQRECDEL